MGSFILHGMNELERSSSSSRLSVVCENDGDRATDGSDRVSPLRGTRNHYGFLYGFSTLIWPNTKQKQILRHFSSKILGQDL